MSEAFTAWRKHLPDLGEELADVALFLVAIAQMNGIDLAEQIERKMAENERRVYHRDDHGVLLKATAAGRDQRVTAATAG